MATSQTLFSEATCAGLDDNGLCRFVYLNTWFPVGGTVWEGLGDVALLEEV